MGVRRKRKNTGEALTTLLHTMLVPEYILKDFDIVDAYKEPDRWMIELEEKEARIPKELIGFEDIILDGFCNSVEVISHSFSLGPVFLKIYRRRWKRKNTTAHYSNEYDLRLKGVKLVPEMGIFLKE